MRPFLSLILICTFVTSDVLAALLLNPQTCGYSANIRPSHFVPSNQWQSVLIPQYTPSYPYPGGLPHYNYKIVNGQPSAPGEW